MKKISCWAKQHKWTARLSIAFIYVALNATGIITGLLLEDLRFILQPAFLLIPVLMFVTAVLWYPSKKIKYRLSPARFYTRQKTCDLLLGFTSFLLIIFVANQVNNPFTAYSGLSAASVRPAPADSVKVQYKTLNEFSRSLKDSQGKSLKWKAKKKLLKHQIKAIREDDEMSKGAKIALIVLSCVVATGLLILLAALACNIACAGSEALAALVVLAGVGLIAVLLTLTIKSILRKKTKTEGRSGP